MSNLFCLTVALPTLPTLDGENSRDHLVVFAFVPRFDFRYKLDNEIILQYVAEIILLITSRFLP